MRTPRQDHDREQSYAEARKVLVIVLVANLLVTTGKLVLGFATGALAVVADGFHSLVDSSSNLVGLAAIRLAHRPADERHPYGYYRYETVGALAIGGMLLVAAYEIAKSILERFGSGHTPNLSPLTFSLIALTLPVNFIIYTLEKRAGKRLGSEILLADAEHTRVDLVVTISVIGGLAGVWLGWLWLDSLVAGMVVVFILRAAYGILRNSTAWLTDAVAADNDSVARIAAEVPGVLAVHHIRSRGTPASAFVDLHVKVDPGMSTEQAHAVATEVENRLRSEAGNIQDALVHIEPAQLPEAPLIDRIGYDLRQIADGMGLGIHDLHVQAEPDGGHLVELHLEIRGSLSLGAAHAIADDFEGRVAAIATKPVRLITHLEPIPDDVLAPELSVAPEIAERIRGAVAAQAGGGEVLEMHLGQHPAGISVAARICLSSDISLDAAHNIAEQLERSLLVNFPEIHRVTVHMEPQP